ncbi:MAG TPA: VWA domain-containing protein [Terriglobia bacterium]|nr:VWA domain-containing protein [Terriglobia bacterium]
MSLLRLVILGCLLTVPILAAQLKVDVALVNVVATVTDEKGRYVSDLSQDDLIIEEDGKPQTISFFNQSSDLPVSVGLTLDTSGSMERKIDTATRALDRFIRTIHRDDDIFLMLFSNVPLLAQDFTDDREKLARALREVRVGGGTALYDALKESLRKIKRGRYDKRAILLVTDGQDTSSENSFDEAAVAVRESELLVYCLGIAPSGASTVDSDPRPTPPIHRDPRDPRQGPSIGFPIPGIPGIPGTRLPIPGGPGGPGGPGRQPGRFPQFPQGGPTSGRGDADTVDMTVLNRFADDSGGKAWLLSGNWTLNRGAEIQSVLDEIAAELRNQYSLGYYPPHDLKDGKWHRIQVRAKNPKYHVRARKEYFGG